MRGRRKRGNRGRSGRCCGHEKERAMEAGRSTTRRSKQLTTIQMAGAERAYGVQRVLFVVNTEQGRNNQWSCRLG